MPREKEISTRLKLRRFEGAQYDHVTVTVSQRDSRGKLQKHHFIVYPASHDIHAEDKQMDKTIESGFTDSDSSDLGPVIINNAGVVSSAMFNKVILLSKEDEQTYCQDYPHDKVTLTIPDEKFDELTQLYDDLSYGKYTYSVVDRGGGSHVHCGTVAQKVLETALKGTVYEKVVQRSDLESQITTHPTSVYQRAAAVARHQQTQPKTPLAEHTEPEVTAVPLLPHAWSLPKFPPFSSFITSFFTAPAVKVNDTQKKERKPAYCFDDDDVTDDFSDYSRPPSRSSSLPRFFKAQKVATSVPVKALNLPMTNKVEESPTDDFCERLMVLDCGL